MEERIDCEDGKEVERGRGREQENDEGVTCRTVRREYDGLREGNSGCWKMRIGRKKT